MKNYFKIGLMALTLAFGVTSCDKQDNGGSAVNALSLEAQGLASKITFSENGGIAAPKGFKNLTAKNAADFANSHIYAESPQMLTILSGDDVQYTGSYAAGNISSLDPSEILLANGNYTAVSSNESSDVTDLVTGFASYSSSAEFELTASGSIQLDVTHDRGFVIADSEDAIDGSRITSVVLSSGEVSGNLILDASDGLNDFYGYLEAGTYDVLINYMLNNSPSSVTGSVDITNGVASTLAPMLDEEAPAPIVTSIVTSSVVTATEAILEGDALAAYNNNDDDLIDHISRVVSSTIVTTDGTPADATFEYGAWELLLNLNIATPAENPGLNDGVASSRTVTSVLAGTEAALPSSRADGGDINRDGDLLDTIERVITTTFTTPAGGVEDAGVITSRAQWSIVVNNAPEAITYDAREYSAYGPAFTDQIANYDQTRTVTNVEGSRNYDPNVAEESLTNAVVVSFTGGDVTAEAGVEATLDLDINEDGDKLDEFTRSNTSDKVYTASVDGTHTVSTADGEWVLVTNVAPPVVAATWEVSDAGVHTNSDYTGYSFTISEEDQFDFSIRFVSNITVPSGSDAIVLGSEIDAATAITAAKAAIVAAN